MRLKECWQCVALKRVLPRYWIYWSSRLLAWYFKPLATFKPRYIYRCRSSWGHLLSPRLLNMYDMNINPFSSDMEGTVFFLSHWPSSESRNLCPPNINPFASDIPGSDYSCQTSIRSAQRFQATILSDNVLPSSQHPSRTQKGQMLWAEMLKTGTDYWDSEALENVSHPSRDVIYKWQDQT